MRDGAARQAQRYLRETVMNISIIGDNETCKATRMLLRQAGFSVRDTPTRADVRIWIDERSQTAAEPSDAHIYFDSIDSPLEANVVRHVSQLSRHAIVIDRPGGSVRSDRELRMTVPEDHFEQQHAVQLGILRGLLDFTGQKQPHQLWKTFLGLKPSQIPRHNNIL